MGYAMAAGCTPGRSRCGTGESRSGGRARWSTSGMVVMVTLLVAAVAVAAKGWAPDVGGALKKALTNAIKKLTDGFG